MRGNYSDQQRIIIFSKHNDGHDYGRQEHSFKIGMNTTFDFKIEN